MAVNFPYKHVSKQAAMIKSMIDNIVIFFEKRKKKNRGGGAGHVEKDRSGAHLSSFTFTLSSALSSSMSLVYLLS